VLFVHGTFSSPNTWNDFPLWKLSANDSNGFSFTDPLRPFVVYRLDWEQNNDGRLDTNANLILPQIEKAINTFRTTTAFRAEGIQRIAAAQADIITHSFGGPVIRMAAQLQDDQDPMSIFTAGNFRNPENYDYGYIHKLIAIAATHRGSQLPAHTAKVNEISGGRLNVLGWVPRIPRIDCGATADQTVISEALSNLSQTIYPSHAVVGSGRIWSADPRNLEWLPFALFNRFTCSSVSFLGPYCLQGFTPRRIVNYVFNLAHDSGEQLFIIDTRPWDLGDAPNYDLTVRLPSMLGGITQELWSGYAGTEVPFTDVYNVDPLNSPSDAFVGLISHLQETKSPEISKKVNYLLRRSTEAPVFSRFPAVERDEANLDDLERQMMAEFPPPDVDQWLTITPVGLPAPLCEDALLRVILNLDTGEE